MIWNLEVPVTKKQPYHSTKSQYEKQFEYWKKYKKVSVVSLILCQSISHGIVLLASRTCVNVKFIS